MSASEAALHLLLVVSLLALGAAGLRLASLVAPSGLERLVTGAVLGAAAAVLETLALGLLGWGGSSVLLALGAGLIWLLARLVLPDPAISARAELTTWWRELPAAARVGVGALGGVAVAVVAILLHRPQPGYDGITYHIPEVVGFVQSGHAGAVQQFYYGLPVGNYPLTNEVLLSWLTGISHGYAALMIWSPVCLLLLIAAGWMGLRELRTRLLARGLALAALVLGPLVVAAVAQPGTDLPGLTWLICCASLCVCARSRPLLLAPAVLAFGLATGTKTTTLLFGGIVLAMTLHSQRRNLRTIALPLGVATLATVVLGATWYVRNLFEHGSPLWPFAAAPWGDPVPPLFKLLSNTMAERLRVTLFDNLRAYLSGVSGSVVLMAGGVLAFAMARRRRPFMAAAITAVGTIVWANTPVTGLPDARLVVGAVGSTVRYLMPVWAAGALALALAATEGRRWGRLVALASLIAAVSWDLVSDLRHSFFLPFSSWLLPGLIAGSALGLLSAHVPGKIAVRRRDLTGARARRAPRIGVVALSLVAAVGGAGVLAAGSAGFVERHAYVASEWDAAVVLFLTRQPGFSTGRASVASTPTGLGLLAGDRLRHRISLIAQHERCPQVLAEARTGWVVLRIVHPVPVPGHPGLIFPEPGSAQSCLAQEPPRFDDGVYRIYGAG